MDYKSNPNLIWNFKKQSCLRLNFFKKNGLKDVTFSFIQSKRKFGVYYQFQKHICLSAPLTELNSEERVRNTLLHEIAHALTPRHGHDNEWRKVSISIGCDGQRLIETREIVMPAGKYEALCEACGVLHKRYRKPSRGFTYFCQYHGNFKNHPLKYKKVIHRSVCKGQGHLV